jgi:hypothetical protein
MIGANVLVMANIPSAKVILVRHGFVGRTARVLEIRHSRMTGGRRDSIHFLNSISDTISVNAGRS